MNTMRFTRWLGGDADDAAKEHYLAEVGGSWADDAVALERVNRDLVASRPGLRAPITEATVRTWTRDDPEFAQALKTAHRHREEARRLGSLESAPILPRFGRDPNEIPAERAFGSHPSMLGWP